jgi:hypothetical protein
MIRESKASPRKRPWTEAEYLRLHTMLIGGKTDEECAAMLKRSVGAIKLARVSRGWTVAYVRERVGA